MARGILILSPYFAPNVGGQETHLTSLCDALVDGGYSVDVVTYRPLTTSAPYEAREQRETLRIRRLPWPHGAWMYWVMHRTTVLYFLVLFPGLFLGALVHLLRHPREIGVIHAHGLVAALIARLLGPVFGIRTVVSIHCVYHFGEKPDLARKVAWIMAAIDGVVPLSPVSERDLLAAGIPEEKFFPLRQWVDLQVFHPDGPRDNRVDNLAPDAGLRLLSVGRLYEGKGVVELAEAVNHVDADIHLFIAGSGPDEDRLRELSRERGRVHLLGNCAQETLPSLYRAVDLVVVPSKVEEGLSRVSMEALACGRPLLVSDRGNLPRMVTPETGFVASPTPEHLAAALAEVAADRGRLNTMTGPCRRRAETEFSPQNVASVLAAYFPETA